MQRSFRRERQEEGCMGLMDRLKAAQAAREADGGEPDVDLTTGETASETTEATPSAIWGRPTPCPACGSGGYLDRIDLVQRIMFQHCPSCLHRWETREADTVKLVDS